MALSEQALAARKAYRREWNKANKDKVKAAQERYWQKKADLLLQEQENKTDELAQQGA